jgi:hypothetical protein
MAGSSVTVVGNAIRLRWYAMGRRTPQATGEGVEASQASWRVRLIPPLPGRTPEVSTEEPGPSPSTPEVPAPEPVVDRAPVHAASPYEDSPPPDSAQAPRRLSVFLRGEATRIATGLGKLFERQWEV